jgi:hypothetical protein
MMKIKQSVIAFVCIAGMMPFFTSCEDWGAMDPAAGTDVYPTRQALTTLSFAGLDSLEKAEFVSDYKGDVGVVYDDSLYSEMLQLGEGGYVQIANPLNTVKLQSGTGITFWVRNTGEADSATDVVLSFGSDVESPLCQFLANGTLLVGGNEVEGLDGEFVKDSLYFVGLQFNDNGYQFYLDGSLRSENSSLDWSSLVSELNTTPYLYIGDPSNKGGVHVEKISVVRNQMTAKDVERPTIKKGAVKLPEPVYFNNFNKGEGDATIIGAGSIRDDENEYFGKVFQNVAGAKSTNYLKLPSHVLSHSAETQEMTIGFWVNAVNAGALNDYTYSPFFSAYSHAPAGDNDAPMFVLQSRGPVQVNNDGWCDFTGANHVDGKVNIYHNNAWEAGDANYNFVRNWLEDNQWHYYTITLKATEVVQYLDGVVTNAWDLDGQSEGQIITGLFNNGAALNYVALGGNQAWNWGDPDAGFAFDDIVVYDKVLTQQQVQRIIDVKNGTAVDDEPDDSEKVYVEVGNPECTDGFWTVFSDVVQLKDGQTAHYGFYNYTAGANNWENWVLICTNNGGLSAGADTEYFVLRADAWAWGMGFDSPGNMTSDYNWETFTADMNGAWVDLTAQRKSNTITVTAVTTTADGKKYNMQYVYDNATADACGLYFTLEKAYLKFDPEQCFVGQKFEKGSYLVGPADCTAGWWSVFSDAYDFAQGPETNMPFVFHFINNNTGVGANWNNWLLVCTTGGGPGNPENFVLRADAYGWGDANYNGANIKQSFNWDTYVADMHGAECWVAVSHAGTTVKMDAIQRKADGTYMPAYSYFQDNISGKVGFFLTAEGASLDILDVAYYPYFSKMGQ